MLVRNCDIAKFCTREKFGALALCSTNTAELRNTYKGKSKPLYEGPNKNYCGSLQFAIRQAVNTSGVTSSFPARKLSKPYRLSTHQNTTPNPTTSLTSSAHFRKPNAKDLLQHFMDFKGKDRFVW